jgi:transcriptional regulator with GAF, ATPase, and Fis domain
MKRLLLLYATFQRIVTTRHYDCWDRGEIAMVDGNEFFREATLRLCSHLDIEEGLRACIGYLSKHIPADVLYLERNEAELGAMRIIARADASSCKRMDLLVPYSEQAKTAMTAWDVEYRAGMMPPVFVINRPQEEPVTRHLLNSLGEPSSSAMSLPLVIEDRIVGALALLAEGDDRFEEHHVELYATLKEPFFVAMSNTLEHQEVVRLKDLLADDYRYLQRELLRISGDEIIGADFGLREVMHKVRHVAPTDSPVLLTGETGVGKDVVANAIHLGSPRREGPFIPVNCGAIPESLLDSELFGHEKGAFTGALAKKRGRFERADRGTILLDEIGEMPLDAQVRLLRVLQHREIERVGGTDRIPVDIRIIAATNKDLKTMVESGRFREDLWFRINVFPIAVPPLRDRSSDIPALVQHFMERKAAELKFGETPRLAPGAIDQLTAYDWPGNVRELENRVERAMILSHGEPLRFDDLDSSPQASTDTVPRDPGAEALDLDTVTKRHIQRVLVMTAGKIHGPGGAGQLLGVNPNTLRSKMRKLGISFGTGTRP